MSKAKLKVGTYREATDGTERCNECGEIAGSDRCMCNDEPITPAARARNAALKVTAPAVLRAACETQHNTPEQSAKRARWCSAIKIEHPNIEQRLLDSMDCELLGRWAEQAAGKTADRAAQRAALQARIDEAGLTEQVERAELHALATQLFGRADVHVFTDQNGTPDPYSSPSNKRSAIEAARLVRDQRKRFEERTAPIREHQAEHRAAAQEVGMFGSVGLQLAKAKLRDELGGGIYGARGLKSREPLPLDASGVPDAYAKSISAKRAKRAEEQKAHDKKWS